MKNKSFIIGFIIILFATNLLAQPKLRPYFVEASASIKYNQGNNLAKQNVGYLNYNLNIGAGYNLNKKINFGLNFGYSNANRSPINYTDSGYGRTLINVSTNMVLLLDTIFIQMKGCKFSLT